MQKGGYDADGKCNVIIMDEPTTGLDQETEMRIMTNIRKAFKDKIVIIISHSEAVLTQGDVRLKIENKKLIQKN